MVAITRLLPLESGLRECKPQEVQKGDYWFRWTIYVTKWVQELLPSQDVIAIIEDIRDYATTMKGIDYLMVYVHTITEQKLFFIDQITKSQFENGSYSNEDYHATLMLASEY